MESPHSLEPSQEKFGDPWSTVSNEPKVQIIVIVQSHRESLKIYTLDLNFKCPKLQALACALDSSTPLPTAGYLSVLSIELLLSSTCLFFMSLTRHEKKQFTGFEAWYQLGDDSWIHKTSTCAPLLPKKINPYQMSCLTILYAAALNVHDTSLGHADIHLWSWA